MFRRGWGLRAAVGETDGIAPRRIRRPTLTGTQATSPSRPLTQPPFATLQIVSGDPNGAATLQSPFVPLVLPTSSYPIFMPRTPTSVPFIESTDPNIQDGKTYEYNLNVQYAPGRDYLVEVGYVGTRSVHRPGQLEFDQALLASPENPVNGETNNSVNNVTARLPIQGVSQGSLLTSSVFIANYNALQASIIKRMQHGLQLQEVTRGRRTWTRSTERSGPMSSSCSYQPTTRTTCATPHTARRATTATNE